MGASASFAVDAASRELTLAAAQWVSGFYPKVDVVAGTDAVAMRSNHHDEVELAAIWASALANERLLAATQAERAEAFAALAR